MKKLLIVDGSNLLFQMFYGMPARIMGKHGRPIQGTLGFVGALLKIIRMIEPTHAVVLFDGECSNLRSELDPAYKANREDLSLLPDDETPFSQLSDIYAALEALGICHKETTDCEADDWIAGYALQYAGTYDVTIVSQDSDFFQLINEHVHVLRYRGERTVICDPGYIQQKLGISPAQYAAWKSLTGDTADNIRGVEKVGPKTASQLLQQFGDLDGLLQNAECIQKPSVREAVKRSMDRIRLNYLLIRLSGSETLPFSMEQLRYEYDGMTTSQVLTTTGIR